MSRVTQPHSSVRVADLGGRVTVERDQRRPGWLCIAIERARRTCRLWLAEDEAAFLAELLRRELPEVTVTHADRGDAS